MDRRSARVREEKLARRRNEEYHRQLLWKDVTQYYKTWDLQATKFNGWISPRSNRTSSDNKISENKCKSNLEERRNKLANLLAEEEKVEEEELKKLRANDNLKRRSQIINSEDNFGSDEKSKENERNSNRVESGRYYQWRSSQSILKEAERKQREKCIQQSWAEQVKEKAAHVDKEKELIARLDGEQEKLRLLQQEKEKQILNEKREEAIRLKEHLLTQMEEVKQKEHNGEELQREADRELQLKLQLEQLALRRDEIERRRKNREHSIFLRHQYQMQLKQKTKQIQEELNEDKRLLEEISRYLEQEQLQVKMKEQAKQEINKANALLKEYIELEKQRENQLQFIFYEEARTMWQNQENRWKVEQEARNNLMRDVLTTVQCQIKEKLQTNAENQKKLLEEREDRVKNMEEANKRLRQTESDIKQLQNKRLSDIQQQIKEKEEEKKKIRESEMAHYKQQQLQIAAEEERISKELKKMNISPLFRGRNAPFN